MGAALRPGDGVDLVQDHRLDTGQGVARRRREHQEEGLGGGDQDVRRLGGHRAALGGRGVAGTDADPDLRLGLSEADGLLPDAGERAAQIALHVHRQGLERGHVQHTAALARLGGRGHRGQPVQGGEEGGQGFSGAGRGHHQHVRALGDGTPGTLLRGGGRGEGPAEPAAGRGRERVECGAGHSSIVHPTTDNRPDLRKRGTGRGGERGLGEPGAPVGAWGRRPGKSGGGAGRGRCRLEPWRHGSRHDTGATRSCPASTSCGPGTSGRRSSSTPTRRSSWPRSPTAWTCSTTAAASSTRAPAPSRWSTPRPRTPGTRRGPRAGSTAPCTRRPTSSPRSRPRRHASAVPPASSRPSSTTRTPSTSSTRSCAPPTRGTPSPPTRCCGSPSPASCG